ncbi:hypothetical protein [Paenibacillus eucommiae]|uniref:Uncharacterized protein n=1 Tax=Paenibacillus eucommiae TaxID=1355755 RepID=A0ABS4J5D5_9BACL|nr:hypothetical protein [Paenibacillus eucommiae]MBP1995043.1 hypothetical protein [Paenibacillus eucommiae]
MSGLKLSLSTWVLLPFSFILLGLIVFTKERLIYFSWLVFCIPAILQFGLLFRQAPGTGKSLILFGCINLVLTILVLLALWYLNALGRAFKN